MSQPGGELLKAELIHAGLTAFVAFTVADQQRSTPIVDVGLVKRQRLTDPQPTAPQDRDQRPHAQTVTILARAAHDRDDLLGARWIGWVLHPLVTRRSAREVAGDGRG